MARRCDTDVSLKGHIWLPTACCFGIAAQDLRSSANRYNVQYATHAGSHLGGGFTSCSQKEDFPSKEAPAVHGGKGPKGCHELEQMLGLRKCEESPFAMSVLCPGHV